MDSKAINETELKGHVSNCLYHLGRLSDSWNEGDLAKAVIQYKKDVNKRAGSDIFKSADATLDYQLVSALTEELRDHERMRGLMMGGAAAVVVGLGAYFLGKRTSRSYAELTVGSYDPNIYLPSYD